MLSEIMRTEQGRTQGLAVIEATLASGALLDVPVSSEPSGRKWRVRIFEYGLSKNRYPWNGEQQGVANRESGVANAQLPIRHSLLPLQWTERSALAALRHLDGARCFADHTPEGASGGQSGGHSVRDLVGFFSEPAIGL